MARLLLIILITQKLITVHNWVIFTETYDNTEILKLFDDDSDSEDEDDDQTDYTLEKPPNNIEERSRVLNFEENYVKPNIEHNLKLFNLYNLERKKKRDIKDLNPDEVTLRYVTEPVSTEDYDYEKLKAEYDKDVIKMLEFYAKLNDSDFLLQPMSECDFGTIYNVGPFTMVCLIGELCHGQTLNIRKDAKENILQLLKLWLVFVVLTFVICWCHCGYCNWLCPSKYCYPEDAYEEIKQVLVLNPPGSRTEKIIPKKDDNSKTVIEKQYYEPTETEYYLYNSLWKDIYHD